jgi:hypothetical protein
MVPPPGTRLRVLAVALMAVALLVFGRGNFRLVILPVAAVAIWIGLDVMFSASLAHVYRVVARQRQARFHPDPFPRGPRLEWTEGAGPVSSAHNVLGPIASGYAGRIARTRMLINEMRSLPVSLEITAGRAPTADGTELPVPGESGPPLRARIPNGRRGGRAGEFLDAYTTERIRALADRAGQPGMRIRISRHGVLVDVGRVLRRAASLNLLIDVAHAVRDRARTLAEGGEVKLGDEMPKVVLTPDGETSAQRSCAVCFEEMAAEAAVRCKECSASHHRDCFEWTGRCGTFSCSGTELAA